MPVPVSPIVGPGLTGLPSRSPVMLIAPPAACAIGSYEKGLSFDPIAQALLVRAAVAEALDLSVDDARIDRADDVVAEPQSLDRAWCEVLGEDISLLHHLLDQRQPALRFQVDGERPLVGVVHHEIVRVAEAGAAGFAALRVLHLGNVGAHPGKRLGARRAGLELRQVEHANTGEEAGGYRSYVHCRLLIRKRS